MEEGRGEEKVTLPQSPIPDAQQLTGEEKHQLIAYRREIAQLKEELAVFKAEKSVMVETKPLKPNAIREALPITILQNALKIKNPTIRKLKSAIREYLTSVDCSKDSQMASTVDETWEKRAANFLDSMGDGNE